MRLMNSFNVALAMMAGGMFVTTATAAVVTYDFSKSFGGSGIGGEDPSFVEPNATAGSLGNGPGIALGYDTNGLFVRSSLTSGFDLASAHADGDYFQMALGVEPGYALTLTQVSFTLRNQYDSGQDTADPKRGSLTTTLVLQSSLDGFGADMPVLGTFTLTNVNLNNNATIQSAVLSLPPITELQTFRFYIYDDGNESNSLTRVKGLAFEGSVVPEPAGAIFLGMVGIFLSRRRH